MRFISQQHTTPSKAHEMRRHLYESCTSIRRSDAYAYTVCMHASFLKKN